MGRDRRFVPEPVTTEKHYERAFGVELKTVARDSNLRRPGAQGFREEEDFDKSYADYLEEASKVVGKPVEELTLDDVLTEEEYAELVGNVESNESVVDVSDWDGEDMVEKREAAVASAVWEAINRPHLFQIDDSLSYVPDELMSSVEMLQETLLSDPDVFAYDLWQVLESEVLLEYSYDPKPDVSPNASVSDFFTEHDPQNSLSITYETGEGDCDDYAMASYELLRASGVPADQLVIISGGVRLQGQDETNGHAVTVWSRPDGKMIIFDNVLNSPAFLNSDFSYAGISGETLVALQFDPIVMYNEERVMKVEGYEPIHTSADMALARSEVLDDDTPPHAFTVEPNPS